MADDLTLVLLTKLSAGDESINKDLAVVLDETATPEKRLDVALALIGALSVIATAKYEEVEERDLRLRHCAERIKRLELEREAVFRRLSEVELELRRLKDSPSGDSGSNPAAKVSGRHLH